MNDIDLAIVLAAGLGTRMRPITLTKPKPLVEVAGRTMLDHALDAAVEAGVGRAVVNVHHLADQIETHLAARDDIEARISDERRVLMDSGGGVVQALDVAGAREGADPFLILNADTFWVDDAHGTPALRAMRDAFDDGTDLQLLLVRREEAIGFAGAGDFFMDDRARLTRRGAAESAPYVYAGAILARPSAFADFAREPFSLNAVFDRALADGRLTGVVMDGLWLHVGTPEAIGLAEDAVAAYRLKQTDAA